MTRAEFHACLGGACHGHRFSDGTVRTPGLVRDCPECLWCLMGEEYEAGYAEAQSRPEAYPGEAEDWEARAFRRQHAPEVPGE